MWGVVILCFVLYVPDCVCGIVVTVVSGDGVAVVKAWSGSKSKSFVVCSPSSMNLSASLMLWALSCGGTESGSFVSEFSGRVDARISLIITSGGLGGTVIRRVLCWLGLMLVFLE